MILHQLIDYETLRLIWWLLLGVLLIGFALTDGFDMGVGALLPFVAKSDTERRVVINTVGPVWEGNQVWFILGGGAIFAAWPPLYAVSFSGLLLGDVRGSGRAHPAARGVQVSLQAPIGALAQRLGLGAVHRRRGSGAAVRRGRGQRAAGRAVPPDREPVLALRRDVLPASAPVRAAGGRGVAGDAGGAWRDMAGREGRTVRHIDPRAQDRRLGRGRGDCGLCAGGGVAGLWHHRLPDGGRGRDRRPVEPADVRGGARRVMVERL